MTEFDYEVLQRKRLAGAARHVKRGSRSKKCTLESDRLTHAQWKKRNGEVLSINLNRPMTWAEFKAIPGDLQNEYITRLMLRFPGLNACSLTQMFRVTDQCIRGYLKEHLGFQGIKGKTMSETNRERWLDFLTAPESSEPESDSPDEVPESELPMDDDIETTDDGDVGVCNATSAHMDHLTVSFSGWITPEEIYNSLRLIMGDVAEGTVTIECKFA